MFFKSQATKDQEAAAMRQAIKDEIKKEQQAEAEAKAKELADAKVAEASAEPWIDVRGEPDSDGRIRLQVDWNDAFIKLLKKNGFGGANDDVIIQQYLTVMHRQLMEQTVGEGHFDG